MKHTIELFSRSYSASPETLWHALKLALPAVAHATTTGLDDERMQAAFTTPISLTSWGQNLTALVSPIEGGGSLVRVYGVPALDFLSTRWGEELHARQIEREFVSALEKALRNGETPIENIELFQLSYEVSPEALWNAFKSALQQMSSVAVTDLDERS